MNINPVLPAISAAVFMALIGVLLTHPAAKARKVYVLYLIVLLAWSLLSFLMRAGLFPVQTIIWHRALLVIGAASFIVLYHFIRVFLNKPAGPVTYLGYAVLIILIVFISLGGMLKSSTIRNGILYYNGDITFYFITLFIAIFLGMATFNLALGFKSTRDAYSRNVIGYLITGASILIVFLVIDYFTVPGRYSVNIVGNLLCALTVSYAISNPHPLDIAFVIRKSLAYLVAVAIIGGIFAGIIYLHYEFLPDQPFYSLVLFLSSSAVLLAFLTYPLRLVIQKRIDRVFFRGKLRYREALLNIASKMGNILNLGELTDEMLPAMSQALLVAQTRLLVEDDKGEFATQFTYPKVESDSKDGLRFGTNSTVAIYLEKQNTILEPSKIDSIPELKGLPESEKEKMTTAGLDLLCPIKSRGKLVGILALAGKQIGTSYSYQDIQLIMNVTGQIGLMIENARLYTQALSWALTDGLTGIYNHRHFHKVLDQEIARSSRYAMVLSVIMIDIDRFKAYNDTFGHPAGDRLLRGVAECITSSIRTADTAFRYGGEEFTVILPETPLNNALIAAERIRTTVEKKTSSREMSITVSLGIASWPSDGVTKEEVIAYADAALYCAKEKGRNRTCLSSELDKTDLTGRVGVQDAAKAASTVYALAAAVDAKDHYTYGHSSKVGDYSIAIGGALSLPPIKISTIRIAGLLHDVGKIGVPDSVLKKAGPLTSEEWEVMKTHPKYGVDIVKPVVELTACLPAILHHHERFDGSGYPTGLKGQDIPLEARILAVADTYDALTSLRHYRERQLCAQDALSEIRRCSGTQFDPDLVKIFCKIIESTK